MNFKANINGMDIEAIYTDEAINTVFIPLLKSLSDLQREKGRRILVMLAAPPGAGKSTLLSFLQYLSDTYSSNGPLTPITTIGMDGFHRYQDYLLSHTIMRDGSEIQMVEVKGAPETFDLERLTERIKRVAAGENCGWPVYNRMTHNPTEDAISVIGDIVLLEGNYLLLDVEGWRELRKYADYTIKITAEEEFLRNRLIDRKSKSGSAGKNLEEAIKFVDFSDMANVRTCLTLSGKADLVLDATDYHIV